MGDVIHIEALELQTRIGATETERAQPQRLTVSVSLHPEQPLAQVGDQLCNTIDYAEVCAALAELSTAGEFCLLETFAETAAALVLQRFIRCAAVDIEVRKYVLAQTQYVAVRLSRTR